MENNKKPDFFIVGAPKCGTTSMYKYLSEHPQIFMSQNKEPHYFGKDLLKTPNYFIDNKNEYLNLFNYAKPNQKIGEASTYYLYSRSAPYEIKDFNPNAKIIIMLRNPIDLIHSLHSQFVYSGNEYESNFEKAINLESERIKGKYIPKNIDIIDKIFYTKYINRLPSQIKKYIDIFGKNNVLIILFDEFKNDPHSSYIKILRLLNIDKNFTPIYKIYNKSKIVKYKWIRNLIKRFHIDLEKIRKLFFKKPIGIIKFINNINSKKIIRKPISKKYKLKLYHQFHPIIIDIENILKIKLTNWKIF